MPNQEFCKNCVARYVYLSLTNEEPTRPKFCSLTDDRCQPNAGITIRAIVKETTNA